MFVKFYFGQQEKLDNKLIENGALYLTLDTKKFFADLNDNRIRLFDPNPKRINDKDFIDYIVMEAEQ